MASSFFSSKGASKTKGKGKPSRAKDTPTVFIYPPDQVPKELQPGRKTIAQREDVPMTVIGGTQGGPRVAGSSQAHLSTFDQFFAAAGRRSPRVDVDGDVDMLPEDEGSKDSQPFNLDDEWTFDYEFYEPDLSFDPDRNFVSPMHVSYAK